MSKKKNLHIIIALALVMVLSFGIVSSASAFEFIEDGDLPADQEIDDDLFIAGDVISVDGTVNGDLFAFGSTVTINGKVHGSLIAMGQTVIINGEVAGSVYSGSSSTVVGEEAEIGRNMYYGGFALEIEEGAVITRDLAMGGYQALLAGEIGRDLYAGVGALEISGTIGGDVNAEVAGPEEGPMPFNFFMPTGAPPAVSPGLRIAESAEIGGQVSYISPSNQSESIETSPDGGVVYSTPAPDTTGQPSSPDIEINYGLQAAHWFLQRARELVTLLALGALVLWQIPDLFNTVIDKATSETLPASGWGLVTVIVGYVGAAIAAGLVLALGIFFGVLTLGGLGRAIFGIGFSSIGLIMAVFVLMVTYGSKLVLAFWSGRWLLGKMAPQTLESKAWFWPLLLGVVIYVFLRAVPFLGWLFGIIVTLIGMGAMWLVFQDWRKSRSGVAIEAEASA